MSTTSSLKIAMQYSASEKALLLRIRTKNFMVRGQKGRPTERSAFSLAEYCIATFRLAVVDIGASSVPPSLRNSGWIWRPAMPRYRYTISFLRDDSASMMRSLLSASRIHATVSGRGCG